MFDGRKYKVACRFSVLVCVLCALHLDVVDGISRSSPVLLQAYTFYSAGDDVGATEPLTDLGHELAEDAIPNPLVKDGHLESWQETEGLSTEDGPVTAIQQPDPIPLHGNARVWLILPLATLAVIAFQSIYRMMTSTHSWGRHHIIEVMIALAIYLGSGSSVILVNKHLIKAHRFHAPIVLANIGNVFLAFVTRAMHYSGFVKLKDPPMTWLRYVKIVIPLAIYQFLTNVLGVWAYEFVSVPLIQIMKGFTIVLVMLFGFVVGIERWSGLLMSSIVAIAAGSTLAAFFEEKGGGAHTYGVHPVFGSAKVFGIILSIVSCMSEAARAVTAQCLMANNSVFDALYYATPVYTLLAIVTAIPVECHNHALHNLERSGMLIMFIILNIILTGLVVLSNFWLVKLTGAIAVKVAMNARNIGLIIFAVLFTGESCSPMQDIGYSIVLFGMGGYDHARKMQAEAKALESKVILDEKVNEVK